MHWWAITSGPWQPRTFWIPKAENPNPFWLLFMMYPDCRIPDQIFDFQCKPHIHILEGRVLFPLGLHPSIICVVKFFPFPLLQHWNILGICPPMQSKWLSHVSSTQQPYSQLEKTNGAVYGHTQSDGWLTGCRWSAQGLLCVFHSRSEY